MKINPNILCGMLSGLLIGGLFDLFVGTTFFTIVFFIFGIQTGIIFMQREKIKFLEKKLK